MKPSEIIGALQKLATNITGDETATVNAFPADTKKRFVPVTIKSADGPEQSKEAPLNTMVPPLQQKMELLKRAVDIDNVFDGTSVDKSSDDSEDYKQEIQAITKNAGINPNVAAIMALSDEEPLDD